MELSKVLFSADASAQDTKQAGRNTASYTPMSPQHMEYNPLISQAHPQKPPSRAQEKTSKISSENAQASQANFGSIWLLVRSLISGGLNIVQTFASQIGYPVSKHRIVFLSG